MSSIIGDYRTFRHKVGREIPHTECRTLLHTLYLLFYKLQRILYIIVYEILCQGIIFAHKNGNVGRAGEVYAEVHTYICSYTMGIRCHSSNRIGNRLALCDRISKTFNCRFSVRQSLCCGLGYRMT